MKATVVCFSGRIASGKTSISRALAQKLNCPWTGFGDYVRAVAVRHGLNPEDRGELQRLGESLIQEHGFDWFCNEVIAAAKWTGNCPLVIDGIRHVEAFATIRRMLSSHQTLLVHLTLESEETLRVRTMQRGMDSEKRIAWEAHSTEQQVLSTLPSIANLTVSADLPVSEITSRIINFLSTK